MQDAASSFQAGSRPHPSGRWPWYDSKHNASMEAIVHSVGPLEQLENTATAFIPALNEYIKVKGMEFDASVNAIGRTSPLTTGDRVLVNFIQGYTGHPRISAVKTDDALIHQYIQQEGNPVPLPDTKYKNRTLSGRPNTFIPEAIRFGSRIAAVVDRLEGIPGRENSPTSKNQIYTSLPGSARWSTPLGDYRSITIGTFTKFAAQEVVANTSPLVNGVKLPIQQATHYLSFVRDTARKYTTGQFRFDDSIQVSPISDGGLTVNLHAGNILTGDSKIIVDDSLNKALFELRAAEQESKQRQELNDCIKGNVKGIQKKAFSILKGLLAQVLKGNLSPLSELNKLLPASLPLSIQAGQDGSLLSIKLGGLTLDPSTQKIKVEGEGKLYDPFIKAGVEEVNKVLPSYLKVSISDKSVNVGDTEISKEDLDKDDVQISPNLKLNLKDDKLSLKLGNKTFDISNVKDGSFSVGSGISALNQKLPDAFQISREGSNIALGPVSIDLKNLDNISFDPVKAQEMAGVFVENQVTQLFSQLPAPAQILARSLWKAGDFGKLIKRLTKPRGSADDKSISLRESVCKGIVSAIPPLINAKPDLRKAF